MRLRPRPRSRLRRPRLLLPLRRPRIRIRPRPRTHLPRRPRLLVLRRPLIRLRRRLPRRPRVLLQPRLRSRGHSAALQLLILRERLLGRRRRPLLRSLCDRQLFDRKLRFACSLGVAELLLVNESRVLNDLRTLVRASALRALDSFEVVVLEGERHREFVDRFGV